LIISMY